MINVEYVVAKGKTEISRRLVTVDVAQSTVVGAVDVSADELVAPRTPADVVFTLTPALAEQIRDGDLTISAGFMRGAIKMAGDNGALLAVLPILHQTNGF